MADTLIIGSTGLVGSQILATLLNQTSISSTTALTRRALPSTLSSPTLHTLIEPSSTDWPGLISTLSPPPAILFSGLATTRAIAGSFAAQRLIDYDLNLALARAAKAAGTKVYVLVSMAGTSKTSPFAFTRMKAELEEEVVKLGFDHTVLLKPGLLLGPREDKRLAEGAMQFVARGMRAVGGGMLTDWWAQDAAVIGRAAVKAGLMCVDGRGEGKVTDGKEVWAVEQADMMRLGKL